MRFVVLGGYGIIGRVVASDLFKTCNDCEIIIAGRNLEKAKQYADTFKSKMVKHAKIDVTDINSLSSLLKNSDVCVNCIQYYFNLQIMKACLKAKVNYVDLGGMFHMTKKQLKLHKSFKKINRLAILGCGSAPGITNILTAYGSGFLKKINSVEILFADKDETKYKQKFVLPYSFKTLIEEYTLKPAVLKNGRLKFVEPRSGIKKYDLGKVFGNQEGFLTPHSEIATLPSFLKEKGIKNIEFRVTFPKEFNDVMKTLISTGFASKKKVTVNYKEVEILEATSSLMDRSLIKPGTKIKDRETLRVIFNREKVVIDAVTNSTFNIPAGTYNTGVPCSAIAQMIANNDGLLKKNGVYATESVINPETFFKELRKRGIGVLKNSKMVN